MIAVREQVEHRRLDRGRHRREVAMVHHPRGDDRVVAGEGAGDVLGALAGAEADLLLLDIDRMARPAGPPPSRSSCGCARDGFWKTRATPLPASGAPRSVRSDKARISAKRLGAEVGDAEQVGSPVLLPSVIIVPMPSSVRISISKACGTRPSMMCAEPTPPSTASAQARSFGIMPARDAVMLDPVAQLGRGQALDEAGFVARRPRAGPARRSDRRSSPPPSPPRSPSPPRRR